MGDDIIIQDRILSMAQYAIAFDMDTSSMENDGFSKSQITTVYQKEIPQALSTCGFTAHPQGSLYHTETDKDPIAALLQIQTTLKTNAPNFCKYVKRVHIFRMEEWSDVTPLLSNHKAAEQPTAEEELEQQLFAAV